MKRALKIVFVLIALIVLIIGILWLVSRKQAQKTGTPAPTFKEFFSRTAPIAQAPGVTNELSGVFAPEANPAASDTVPETNPGISTSFTNTTITPTSVPDAGTGAVSPTTPINTLVQPENTNEVIQVPPTKSSTVSEGTGTIASTGPECSVTDTNIAFTPEELERLNILQQRFNTIAPYLHTDGDIAIVEANYDSYKVKGEQVDELVGYYETNLQPRLPINDFNRRVATPFWHDTSQDSQIFGVFFPLGNAIPYDFRMPSNYSDEHSNDDHHRGVLEHALGINIW